MQYILFSWDKTTTKQYQRIEQVIYHSS